MLYCILLLYLILLYNIHIHILLYYILYIIYILYSSIFYSSYLLPFPSPLIPSSASFPLPHPPLLFSYLLYFSLPIFQPSSSTIPPHSQNTCRHLDTLTYIPSISHSVSVGNTHLSLIIHLSLISIYLIHSIRVGIWISLFIFQTPLPNSTPHVLSEWMVEVCRFEQYVVRFGCFHLGVCFKNSGF